MVYGTWQSSGYPATKRYNLGLVPGTHYNYTLWYLLPGTIWPLLEKKIGLWVADTRYRHLESKLLTFNKVGGTIQWKICF